MMDATPGIAAGYQDIQIDGKRLLVRDWAADALRAPLRAGTLYDWASAQEGPDLMRGRGLSYGVNLPAGDLASSTPVVVRRNRHGGMLRFFNEEHFLLPTRAPLELTISLRLFAAGIPTPEVVACAVYPVAGLFGRSDVMTRRLPAGADLPAVWQDADAPGRELLLDAVGKLVAALNAAGGWHADLNLKNIYISGGTVAPRAYLLDVDRVTFPVGGAVAELNFLRLARSARKWRERRGLDFDEAALSRLASLALERP